MHQAQGGAILAAARNNSFGAGRNRVRCQREYEDLQEGLDLVARTDHEGNERRKKHALEGPIPFRPSRTRHHGPGRRQGHPARKEDGDDDHGAYARRITPIRQKIKPDRSTADQERERNCRKSSQKDVLRAEHVNPLITEGQDERHSDTEAEHNQICSDYEETTKHWATLQRLRKLRSFGCAPGDAPLLRDDGSLSSNQGRERSRTAARKRIKRMHKVVDKIAKSSSMDLPLSQIFLRPA